jgi:phosphoenolpyruvate phosphomutase / 2-hydroxyethylphosphonate cytidylyltransferase
MDGKIDAGNRRKSLKRLLSQGALLRFLEVHDPVSALIAERSLMQDEGKTLQFDGFWSSSLADSTSRGKPDNESLDVSSRLSNVNDIFNITTKPLIFDGNTGGKPEQFALDVQCMEKLGISAVIVEDKNGLKKNSLFAEDVHHTQEEKSLFCEKIRAGRSARLCDDFMVIARIESLILNKGMQDAITRARAYAGAGADGIMIHSRKNAPDEVFEFARIFHEEFPSVPLVCVPTSYATVTEEELIEHGFAIVIYANHLLRAAYPAMQRAAFDILRHGRAAEAEANLMPIDDILKLIPCAS